MGSEKDRVHPRYRVDLVATVRWRREVLAARVFDVSLMGAFLVGDRHPNLRELVRIEFELPGRTEPFSVHGMAVNFAHVGDAEGRPPGFGVQLYAMDREMQRQWAQFIEGVKKSAGTRPAVRPVTAPTTPMAVSCVTERNELPPLVVPEPLMRTPTAFVSRSHALQGQKRSGDRDTTRSVAMASTGGAPRATASGPTTVERTPTHETTAAGSMASTPPGTASTSTLSVARGTISRRPPRPEGGGSGGIEFEVDMRSLDELELFYERDAAVGGMFIPTELELQPRSLLKVFLRHPVDGRFFELDARVHHIERDLDSPGLGVEFVGLGPERRAALHAFVYGHEAGARPDRGTEGIWDFDPRGAHHVPGGPLDEERLLPLFEPWGVDELPRSWVPPREEEFDQLFASLDKHEASGLRRSHRPSMMPVEEPPDFRLSIPSWTQLEVSASVVPIEEVIDLTDEASLDLVEDTPLPQGIGARALHRAAR